MESDLSNGHMIRSDGSGGIALIHSMNNGAGSGSGSGSGSSSSSGASATKDISHPPPPPPSRYESQKRRDWHTFGQYLKNHRPPLALAKCSGAHVLEFLRYLDQFGKTKVHVQGCPFFGHPHPPAPCGCPLRQAWGSLDALIGRLRAAYEEHGGKPESNPFGARAVRLFLRDVREHQAKARGIAYEKKKRRRPPLQQQQQQQQLAQQNETSNAGRSQVVQHQSNNVQTQHQVYQQQQHQQISHHQQLQATIQQFQQQQQQMHSHHHLGGHVISVAVSQFLSNDPNSVMLAAMPNHN